LPFVDSSSENDSRVGKKLDSYDRLIWIKRVIKIQRTMAVLEQQKHLKPFMSHAIAKLTELLLNCVPGHPTHLSYFRDAHDDGGDCHSEERAKSAVSSQEYGAYVYCKQSSASEYHSKFIATTRSTMQSDLGNTTLSNFSAQKGRNSG